MARGRTRLWLGLLAGIFWTGAGAVQAQSLPYAARGKPDQWERVRAAAQVPIDQLPVQLREEVRLTLERPTLFSTAPAESFLCRPEMYYWLLDHPDRAMTAWQRLGASCVPIVPRGNGRFGWNDEHGSDVSWETVVSGPNLRVWYAQGQVKPGPMLPTVPVRAVVVLRHNKIREHAGSALMSHQADVFVHTDSRTAALVTRLMGPSAPRMAEQGVAQMQMFFSALAWYLQRHPDRTETLLNGSPSPQVQPPATGQAAPPAQVPAAAVVRRGGQGS